MKNSAIKPMCHISISLTGLWSRIFISLKEPDACQIQILQLRFSAVPSRTRESLTSLPLPCYWIKSPVVICATKSSCVAPHAIMVFMKVFNKPCISSSYHKGKCLLHLQFWLNCGPHVVGKRIATFQKSIAMLKVIL